MRGQEGGKERPAPAPEVGRDLGVGWKAEGQSGFLFIMTLSTDNPPKGNDPERTLWDNCLGLETEHR